MPIVLDEVLGMIVTSGREPDDSRGFLASANLEVGTAIFLTVVAKVAEP